MSFEEDIKQHRLERINSLYYQIANSEDNIRKSVFRDIQEISGNKIRKSIDNEIYERKGSLDRIDKSLTDTISTIQVQPKADPCNYIPRSMERAYKYK